MKYTVEPNYIETADITATNVQNDLQPLSTLYDRRTTRSYVADQDGSSDVGINFVLKVAGSQAERTVDMVAIVGLSSNITSVDVTLNYLASPIDSETVSVTIPVQQSYAVAIFDSEGADEVDIEFNVGDGETFYLGYVFIGALSDSLTIARDGIQYRVASADPRNITRAGVPLTTVTYRAAEIGIAIVEETFSTLRARAVDLAEQGFATPRIWYFDETCILTGESVYAILDADNLPIDPRWIKGEEAKATTAFGLQEVF